MRRTKRVKRVVRYALDSVTVEDRLVSPAAERGRHVMDNALARQVVPAALQQQASDVLALAGPQDIVAEQIQQRSWNDDGERTDAIENLDDVLQRFHRRQRLVYQLLVDMPFGVVGKSSSALDFVGLASAAVERLGVSVRRSPSSDRRVRPATRDGRRSDSWTSRLTLAD